MSAAPARFTFDLDLGRRQDRNRLLSEDAVADLTAEARNAGFGDGFTAGEQGALARSAGQMATAATELGDRVAAMAADMDRARRATIGEAVHLAAGIARKLSAGLITQAPTAEIEALLAECLATIGGAPHLVIRCHPDLADAVRDIATRRVATAGFDGRLVVMGEPEIALGDCRLEWVDGGLIRDSTAIDAAIDQRISAYLAAHGSSSGAERAGEKQ